MDRHKPKLPGRDTRTRIAWREGQYRIECRGEGEVMSVLVYDGTGTLMAQEPVGSAEEGWRQGTSLCRELAGGGSAVYRRGSA